MTAAPVRTAFLVVFSVCFMQGIACREARAVPPDVATSRKGMVVTVSAPASEVGAEILRRGGNAVDAAVAVAVALEVTWPEAGNIGGGGFMMVAPGQGKPTVCVEYRETAPAAATRDMFSMGESRQTLKVVGVPGTVRGLELALKEYGTLPWKELVAPAIRLARDGFEVDEGLARSLNGVLSQESSQSFKELYATYAKPDGTPWKPGDRLVQPVLARTLSLLAEQGPDAFYTGPIAEQLVTQMESGGGLITRDDLKNYRARIRAAVKIPFRDSVIFAPPPPSSGGICLAEMFGMAARFDWSGRDRFSPETVHLLAEIMRRGFVDRARYLGDSDFTVIPAWLTSPEHAAELARTIDPEHATVSTGLAPDVPLADESPETTHFSIVDGQGMAVSNTYTLEASFGARIVVRGGGYLLNNEMGDFNWKPGHTDRRGRIGTEPNTIAPGKRMLSSQSPVIVTRDGEVILVTGSPGGRTIINTVFCVLANRLIFDMTLPDAVAAPRQHHQWLPDRLQIEQSDDEATAPLISGLKSKGHTVNPSQRQGDAHSIERDPRSGQLTGVADKRRSGSAAAPIDPWASRRENGIFRSFKGNGSTMPLLLTRPAVLLGFLLLLEYSMTAHAESPSPVAVATFGGGCFWCTEAVFAELRGVDKVVSGYSGGTVENPTYKQVCTGETGHAEAVQITYHPDVIPFESLLEVFFSTHDPTTLNRQGADVGTQYRSVIFYESEQQKQIAERIIRKLNDAHVYPSPIVTQLAPLGTFYPAEDSHQDYFALNGRAPYCRAVIQPKMEKFRMVFQDRLKQPQADAQP